MLVVEITYPGTRVRHPDWEWVWRVELLLGYLERQLVDAVVALNLFQRAPGQVDDPWCPSPAREAAYDKISQEIEEDMRRELGDEVFFEHYPAVQEMIERNTRQRLWQHGEMPVEYARRVPFLYAHMFLYALDSFGKILGVLAQENGVLPSIREEDTKFRAALPHLKAVRDSAHHIEDRGRGLDKRGQPIRVRALELSNLWGDKLVYTAADGHRAEISINTASAAIASSTFQRVVNAFDWEGRKRVIPC